MTLLHIEINIDSQDFTLDQQSYGKMIDYMNTLTPFEAIRYAAEINKMNGFEVVSRVEIAEWKKAVNHFEKKGILKSTIEKSKSISRKKESESYKGNQSEFENIKMKNYQRDYMSLLSV